MMMNLATCGVVHTGRVDSTGRAEIGSINCGRVETDQITSTGTFHIGGLQNLLNVGKIVTVGKDVYNLGKDGYKLYKDVRGLQNLLNINTATPWTEGQASALDAAMARRDQAGLTWLL